jgi:hypothetical protein
MLFILSNALVFQSSSVEQYRKERYGLILVVLVSLAVGLVLLKVVLSIVRQSIAQATK